MRARQPFSWIMFFVSAAVAVALFVVPAFIIRPFHHQSPSALGLALALRQRAPWGTLAALLLCLILAFSLWRGDHRRRTIVLGSCLFLAALCAVMSRVNYFEWMFHPVDSPQFEAESASKLDAAEMILAIRSGPDARAYPIREMAYHHVLNDTLSGVPIVVTY